MSRAEDIGALGLLVLALFCGVIAASGIIVAELLLAGLLVCGLTLLLPDRHLVLAMMVLTFVVQGSISYFLRLPQAAWLPYLAGILLLVRWLFRGSAKKGAHETEEGGWLRGPGIFVCLYVIALVGGIIANRPSASITLIGLKNALPIWIAAVFFMRGKGGHAFDGLVWRALTVIMLFQVPVVAYQHFVIVPARPDITTAMDAVVGTFGGLIDAGGANATLVIFALLGMAYAVAMFNQGLWSATKTTVYFVAGLILIFSGEVKAALIWIPLTLLLVNRRRIFRSVVSMITITALGAVLIAALFMAYDAMYWSKSGERSAGDRVERMAYFFDTHNINYLTGEISRGASVALWVGDASMPWPNRLLGYGPGSSRISATGGLGEVAKRFAPLNVAATGMSMLLWDSGFLGFLAFLALLVSLAWQLYRVLASGRLSPSMAAIAEALGAFTVLAVSLLFYNRALLDEPSMQLLLAMALGYSVRFSRLSQIKSLVS